ncbi:LytR/AlgR family response regulator transcription factor [Anaerorhabdus sp.]|uniref:LytR/AlgR family response regulator transcription factor n=1 Tax=Anaerorhabdus sp. TaxID=1872524 RepID=UPI002FC8142D
MEIKVAVVDDNIIDLHNITNEFKNYKFSDIVFNIEEFNDRSILENRQLFDLYLLDIDMPQVNGIEIANKINETSKNSGIIFVSRREDLVFDTFIVESLYFVRKDKLANDLKLAIEKYCALFEKNNQVFRFSENGNTVVVKYQDIYYFEVYKNNMYIVVENKTYSIRKSMKNLIKEIDNKTFSLIHESFYVNLGNIERMDNNLVILKNKQELQISRRKIKMVRDEYANFLMR